MMTGKKITNGLMVALVAMGIVAGMANAAPVVLQNATGTATAHGSFPVSKSIDGDLNLSSGWYAGANAIAAYETVSDLAYSDLTFTIYDRGGFDIDGFRISVTTDDRSTFADGLTSGGDVTANWTVLTPLTSSGTINGDGSVDLSTTNTNPINTMTAQTPSGGITGFRFEMLDASGLLAEIVINAEPAAPPPPATPGTLIYGK